MYGIHIVNKQHDVPPGKHAIISVRQPKGDLIWIQTPASTAANKKKTDKEKFKPKLTTWDDCDIIQVCLHVGHWLSNFMPKIVHIYYTHMHIHT